MCGSLHFVTEQSRKLWNTPAPVTMETKGKLFHVSRLVAHGNCPEIEGWIKRKRREREISSRERGGNGEKLIEASQAVIQ